MADEEDERLVLVRGQRVQAREQEDPSPAVIAATSEPIAVEGDRGARAARRCLWHSPSRVPEASVPPASIFPARRGLLTMPIYEYRCPNGHTFELFQRMSDAPAEACEICGEGPVTKVLYPAAIHFKGSGFYRPTTAREPALGLEGRRRRRRRGRAEEADKKESKASDAKASDPS